MKTTNSSLKDSLSSVFAAVVIPIEIIIAILIYLYVLGDPVNFEGGDPANHPLPGNYFGIIYKGGPIVPVLISLLLITITFSIERFITLTRSKGKGSIRRFVQNIRHLDRKSTRLNSSHVKNSYTVFCRNKKRKAIPTRRR